MNRLNPTTRNLREIHCATETKVTIFLKTSAANANEWKISNGETTGLPSFHAAVQADENVNNVTRRGELHVLCQCICLIAVFPISECGQW
jgi:hypothetical protein